ncbi:hypothetical protein DKG77_15250 [Flagellimonas aquimarina]|uniref:UspA domain-containing protein n=1 Tax=Flagellimonas aquimarina TaxID=2201895 RepID=A0A316L0H6_9FLAO|nr:universal stress protein [Allomuricauda koreensis]PWL37653.1 hypothetical protein DKG77_15250 [Allomuricauda koreensis]
MQRILFPTDFSENAWNAVAFALSLFKNEECEFFIMNVFQLGSSGLVTTMNRANETRLYKITKEESKKGLQSVLKRIEENYDNPKHKFNTLIRVSTLTNAIRQVVFDKDIDYIIMGTKGATGLKEVFMGSNAYKTIKNINLCPIIAVPDDFEQNVIETILFITGFEHIYHTYEIKPMVDIAKILSAKIRVLYLGDLNSLEPHQKTAYELIQKRLKIVEHEIVILKKEKPINVMIKELVEENNDIGVVCMINYWHSFLEKITHEPVIKKVAFNTKVPFLVMHLYD